MEYQSVPMLSARKFREQRDNVKYELIAYGLGVWKLVCDGYCNDSPSVQE